MKSTRKYAEMTRTYFRSGYHRWETNLAKARVKCPPTDVQGMMMVMQFCIGAIRMAPDYATGDNRSIHGDYETRCPFCERQGSETAYHLIFKCQAWYRVRQETGLLETIEAVTDLLRK